MYQLALNNPLKNRLSTCGDLMTMAEQELAAFFAAVTRLFGSEQAKISAEDWLSEFAALNDFSSSTERLRRLTVDVSARLARRVNR